MQSREANTLSSTPLHDQHPTITRLSDEPAAMIKKSQLDYVSIDDSFTPLPKHGHLSEKTAEYAAIEPSLHAGMEAVLNLPDFPAFRELAGDPDAVMPPGGPDRVRDVVTELLFFKARDGSEIELKVYKSPNVLPDATLMIRMHGGGTTMLLELLKNRTSTDGH